MTDIYDECESLVIKCGDLLLDPINNSVGVLYKRVHYVSEKLNDEDMYLWSIYWTKIDDSVMLLDTYSQIEEFGLKMSIVVGLYDLVTR
jgi:hypothetical protein